jgi:hypothetical protein
MVRCNHVEASQSGRKQDFRNVSVDAIYEINEEQGLGKLISLATPPK